MVEQALGRVGAAVEDDVLAGLAQIGLDRLIDASWPALTIPISMPA